ncbi:hypothetical protein [Mycobacteroides abscessus]|nr:hypothetical protein [Mycobacteroides abscessus]MBN7559442.1 hypothetical protein [Mycobacteroides abscessus subsp. abscessus]
MAALNFSGRLAEAMAALLALSAEEAVLIAENIEAARGNVVAVAGAFDKVGDGDGKHIMSSLVRVLAAVREHRIDTDELIDGWIRDAPDEIKTDGSGLRLLVKNNTLRRFAKALGLRNDYERITLDTRILTDIRPVFEDAPDVGEIGAAIINHTVRFTYTTGTSESSAVREAHFAMDTDDLEKLKAQIERAIAKAGVSQAFLTNMNVLALEPLEGMA